MATYHPSVMTASLQSDSIETILPGMLVTSLGRVDVTQDLFRVKITNVVNDTRVAGVIHSVPDPTAITDSDTSSEYHNITICPIRHSVMSSDASASASASASSSDDTSAPAPTFQFTPVWVLFDPTTHSSSQPMTRISPGSLLTSSPIPGFAMAQTYTADESTDTRIVYYSYTVGRAVTSCFPYTNLRDCIAKGELHVQPDYLQFKVQRDIAEVEPTVYNIYGHFSESYYVGKTLKAGLIPAIVG